MADTQHSTTTRRAILTGIAAAPIMAIPAAHATMGPDDTNQVVAAWRAWWALERERPQLYTKSQAILATLPEHVRAPRVLILKGKYSGDEWWASTVADIDRYFDRSSAPTPASEAARQSRRAVLTRELEAARAYADAELTRVGYTQLEERADKTFEEQFEQVAIIEDSRSRAVAAIAAKLSIALAVAQDRVSGDWQWELVRGALTDLLPSLPIEMLPTIEAQIQAATS